jgi:hypothetical protein
MNELVKYENGVLVAVSGDEADRGDLTVRPDGSVAPFDRADGGAPPTRRGSRRGSRRSIVLAVVAVALVASVAVGAAAFAGGSGGSTRASAAPGAAKGSLAASASNSANAGTVAFTVSASETSPATTTQIVSGAGSVDLAKGVGQITATVPALSSILGGDSSVTVVSDGKDLYLDVPAISSLVGGKTWLKASPSSASSLIGGSSAGSLSLSTLTDPGQVLALLGSLGSPVTNLGTVQLGGTSTTEYRTAVSLSGLASQLGAGSTSSSAGALSKALQQLGVATVPVTVWVGQDGLVRQVALAVDLSHATLGGLLGGSTAAPVAGSSLDLTVGFSHYGQPVSVNVPPASQVTDLSSIISSLQGTIGSLKGTVGKVGSTVSDLISRA